MVSVRRSCAALRKSFSITGGDGKQYRFGESLIAKYMNGNGRKHGMDSDRLRHMPKAIEAVKNTLPRIHAGDNPPQKTFFSKTDGKHATIVFADAGDNTIRGFIYSKNADKMLQIHMRE